MIFIIHGSFGNPQENWFPWLKKELEKRGEEVVIPAFPLNEGQNLENWTKTFEPYKENIDENTIFIGHSLAPAFILSILEKLECSVKACFFVSGFLHLLGNETFDEVNKTFVQRDFDWESIRKQCEKFVVFHGNNDPYVPLTEGKELAEKVKGELIILPEGGHVNAEAGFTAFPQLLDKLLLFLPKPL